MVKPRLQRSFPIVKFQVTMHFSRVNWRVVVLCWQRSWLVVHIHNDHDVLNMKKWMAFLNLNRENVTYLLSAHKKNHFLFVTKALSVLFRKKVSKAFSTCKWNKTPKIWPTQMVLLDRCISKHTLHRCSTHKWLCFDKQLDGKVYLSLQIWRRPV